MLFGKYTYETFSYIPDHFWLLRNLMGIPSGSVMTSCKQGVEAFSRSRKILHIVWELGLTAGAEISNSLHWKY